MPEPALTMWVIYDHPSDFPEHYVARVFHNGVPDEGTFMQASEVDTLHLILLEMGLTFLPRMDGDAPHIVGAYL